jgi:protein-export membrane protein SecD
VSLRARSIWVGFVSALMIFMAVPSLMPESTRVNNWFFKHFSGVQLGLDLQGGIHWLLAVDPAQVTQQRLEGLAADFTERAREGEKYGTAKVIDGPFLELCGADPAKLDEIRGDARLEEETIAGTPPDCSRFSVTSAEQRRELRRNADAAMEVIKRRVTAVQEPIITRQGDDRILVQLPGVDDPVRARKLITGTTFLAFKKVLGSAENEQLLLQGQPDGKAPADTVVVSTEKKDEFLLVPKDPLLTGIMLEDARLEFDRLSQPVVSFTWNAEGARIFRQFTSENVGQRMAAIIDNVVITAPVIRSEIGRSGQIEGGFTQADASDLALRLRSGSLPISLRILEERTVGPGLGADSIKSGVYSTIFGGLAVFVITAIYYGLSGLLADITLALNLFIVLAFMGGFDATLTLPGIAGLALTVGMAVDSNIIVFERIREEIRAGRPVRSAVQIGFNRSLLTILDANVTTLIAAGVLYYVGRGPVQGFGVTLAVGIFATVFCALTVTKLLMELALERSRTMRI